MLVRIAIYYLFIIICVLLFSCNSKTSPSVVLIEEYNQTISKGYENGEGWVESPLFIAIHLAGAGEVSREADIHFEKLNKGEVPTEVKIKIHEKGVLDDSNGDSRSAFHLKLIDERWQVIE